MTHRCRIAACRKRERSDLTGCDVLSTYGHRFLCTCGARGKVRHTVREARLDLSEHLANVT